MPGTADRADAVEACPLRYVLDGDAADECLRLLSGAGAAALDVETIRLPSTAFWAEWAESDGRRTGVLVAADESGRRGTLEAFWERGGEQPDRAQALVLFDLDRAIAADADWRSRFAFAPGAHRLAPHLLFEVDHRWIEHFRQGGAASALRALETVASNLVPAVDLALALSALLSTRTALATDAVDRSRINRARRRSGKPPLLDYVEVRLDLHGGGHACDHGAQAGERGLVRRHHVRGHMVRRAGRLFWRRPHLRGVGVPATVRTVLIGCTPKTPRDRRGRG